MKHVDGKVRKVPFRRLQLLMEPSWGLQDRLPILDDIEVTDYSTLKDLSVATTARGLSTAVT